MENSTSLPAGVLYQEQQSGFRLWVAIRVATYLCNTGRNSSALLFFHECVELAKLIQPADSRNKMLLSLYSVISTVYHAIEDLKSAIKYVELTVNLEEKVSFICPNECTSLWESYKFLGGIYRYTTNYKKAIESLEKALGYARDSSQKGRMYIDLAATYLELSDTEKAADHIKKAKNIIKEGKTPRLEGDCLQQEGMLYSYIGDHTKAITSYKKELSLRRTIGDKKGECRAYSQLSQTYCAMKNFIQARENHQMALNSLREWEIEDIGQLYEYIKIAVHSLNCGDFERARDYCQRALSSPHGLWDLREKKIVYLLIGLIEEKNENIEGAIDSYQHCVEVCEEIEQRLGEKDDHKVFISETHFLMFLVLTRALIRDGQEIRALRFADRGRTRALADLMTSNYDIKAENISHVNRLSIKEIQQIGGNMASKKSAILVTAIGISRVYLWHLIKSDGTITFKEIPLLTKKHDNDHIQSIVDMSQKELQDREYKDGEKCEDRSLPSRQEKDQLNSKQSRSAHTVIDEFMWRTMRMENCKADSSFEKQESALETTGSSLRVLYDLIVAPMADLLDRVNEEDATEELVFAPDGPLCLVPFSALQGPDGKCLIDKYRIRVIPSLTTLNQIITSPADYHNNTGALIVGDPDVGVVEYDGKLTNISRLPCAKTEAKRIGKLLKVEPLTGHKATKEEVLKRMTSVSLVHLAAHGNPKRGEIALAPVSRVRYGPTEEKDYLLSMADVQSVKLRAKLVVLSCCHSGRGDVKPEGVVGIARAFLGAGARSVLVSLWDISDAATLHFMCHFYQHLVQGKSASVALHQATKELKNSEKFGKPRNWAPFMLIGDDVTISTGDKNESDNS